VARSRSARSRFGAVEAEHVVDAGLVGHQDLVRVQRVDAQREAALAQRGDRRRPLVEPRAPEREPEIDHVGALSAVALGLLEHRLAAQPRYVVDLGEHAHVARAVGRAPAGAAEVARERLQVGRPLLDGEPEALGEHVGLALAQSRDHDPRDRLGDLQEARDPARGHERRDGDLHHRDVVVERQLSALERVAQRARGQLARDEQQALGHAPSASPC